MPGLSGAREENLIVGSASCCACLQLVEQTTELIKERLSWFIMMDENLISL